MTAVVGYAGILLALVSAAALVIQGARAQWVSDVDTSVLKLPVLGIAAGAVLAMGALEVALLSDDFSIEYVARNSSAATPTIFKAASAWAALEGSIVLWGLVLAGYTFAVWRSAIGVAASPSLRRENHALGGARCQALNASGGRPTWDGAS